MRKALEFAREWSRGSAGKRNAVPRWWRSATVPRAHAVAERLGGHHWDDAHESDRFVLSTRDMATAARNWLAFWDWERVGIAVAPGSDELTLALTADALARTHRTSVFAVASSPDPISLKHGLRLVPDLSGDAPRGDRIQGLAASDVPITAVLDRTLASTEQVNGSATADIVALQIEYSRAPPPRGRSAALTQGPARLGGRRRML